MSTFRVQDLKRVQNPVNKYILDNKNFFQSKNVLDIGSGSGACALAAAKSDSNFVLANDIDPVSITAIWINSKLNDLKLHTSCSQLIGENIDSLNIKTNDGNVRLKWDVVLIGDMFYDTDFAQKLFVWLCELVKQKKKVYVGDPGRHGLKDLEEMSSMGTMLKISEYALKNTEHNGFSYSAVYTIQCP